MSTDNLLTMRKRCDKLTKGGKRLSIIWDGGNDSGWFQMKLDDEDIANDDFVPADPIIEYVAEVLEYESFAGDFCTEGELIYNRQTKCFEGTDKFTQSESKTIHCAMEISLPRTIWFDEVAIHIEAEDLALEEPRVLLIVKNGPRIADHVFYEKQLASSIEQQLKPILQNIDDLTSLWDEIIINHGDFISRKEELVFTIRSFECSVNNTEEKKITIPFTGKIDAKVNASLSQHKA